METNIIPRPLVDVVDIQIRLSVVLPDGENQVTFVTSWYGPEDQMRFAAFRKSSLPIDEDRVYELEAEARQLLAKKIDKLDKALRGIV